MANTKQARKRARQTVARNLHLAAQRSQYRTAIKKVRKLVAAGDGSLVEEINEKGYERFLNSVPGGDD